MNSSEYLQLNYFAKSDEILRVSWRRTLTQAEMEASHTQLRTAAAYCRVTCWLFDMRGRIVQPSQFAWLYDSFLPSLYPLFAEPVRVAIVLTRSQLQMLQQNSWLWRHPSGLALEELPFCLQLFTEEDSAYSWLQQPHAA